MVGSKIVGKTKPRRSDTHKESYLDASLPTYTGHSSHTIMALSMYMVFEKAASSFSVS